MNCNKAKFAELKTKEDVTAYFHSHDWEMKKLDFLSSESAQIVMTCKRCASDSVMTTFTLLLVNP